MCETEKREDAAAVLEAAGAPLRFKEGEHRCDTWHVQLQSYTKIGVQGDGTNLLHAMHLLASLSGARAWIAADVRGLAN